MQSLFILIVVVAASSLRSKVAGLNVDVGKICSGDTLLSKSCFERHPAIGVVQNQTVIFRGSTGTNITAIKVTEVGPCQNATVSITAGGLASNFVTMRISSAKGRGFHYRVEIWGH